MTYVPRPSPRPAAFRCAKTTTARRTGLAALTALGLAAALSPLVAQTGHPPTMAATTVAHWLSSDPAVFSLNVTALRALTVLVAIILLVNWARSAFAALTTWENRDWKALDRALPADWQAAVIPSTLAKIHVNDRRVLIAPSGRTYDVSVSPKRQVTQGPADEHAKRVLSRADIQRRRTLVAKQYPVAGHLREEGHQAMRLIWLPRAQGRVQLEEGLTIVSGDAMTFVRELQDWEAMALRVEANDPSRLGLLEEDKAIQEALTAFPKDWVISRNKMLRFGGDVDLYIVRPDGLIINVDIKLRQGVPVLKEGAQNGGKDWQEIHDQLVTQSQQTGGVPVVWQRQGRSPGLHRFGRCISIHGDADLLRQHLERLPAAAAV